MKLSLELILYHFNYKFHRATNSWYFLVTYHQISDFILSATSPSQANSSSGPKSKTDSWHFENKFCVKVIHDSVFVKWFTNLTSIGHYRNLRSAFYSWILCIRIVQDESRSKLLSDSNQRKDPQTKVGSCTFSLLESLSSHSLVIL